MFRCPYCRDQRREDDGHSCEGLRRMQAKLSVILGDIKLDQIMPNSKPETSMQMRNHADQKRAIATQVVINGGAVKNVYR